MERIDHGEYRRQMALNTEQADFGELASSAFGSEAQVRRELSVEDSRVEGAEKSAEQRAERKS